MILFLLLVGFNMRGAAAADKNDSIFKVLDTEIRLRPSYSEKKEAKIDAVKKEYRNALAYDGRFEAAIDLFNEYRCYQSDSAYRYALLLQELAAKEGDRRGAAVADLALMDYYTSVGFFKEASEIKGKINRNVLPEKYLPHYYNLCNRYFQNIGGYVGGHKTLLGGEYNRARLSYLDSLISVLSPSSGAYHIAVLEKNQILNPSNREAIAERLRILSRYELTDHEKAVQYSLLGRSEMEITTSGVETNEIVLIPTGNPDNKWVVTGSGMYTVVIDGNDHTI